MPNPQSQIPSDPRELQERAKPALCLDYFGVQPRKFLELAAVIVGAAVLTTLPYVLVVGYDKWSNDVTAAGNLMLAQYPATAIAPPAPSPQRGTSPTAFTARAAPRVGSAPAGRTRQYTCPVCGAAATPNWTSDGQPSCPACGNTMSARQ